MFVPEDEDRADESEGSPFRATKTNQSCNLQLIFEAIETGVAVCHPQPKSRGICDRKVAVSSAKSEHSAKKRSSEQRRRGDVAIPIVKPHRAALQLRGRDTIPQGNRRT